jgi:glycosyltransferase involved in cell wall biosynthesis
MPGKDQQVIFYSRFLLEELGGGCRREMQLAEALDWLDPTFTSAREGLDIPLLPPAWTRVGKFVRQWPPEIRAYVARIRRKAREWANSLSPDNDLLIMDDPVFFLPLVQRARQLKIPMVHLCHNLEALCLMKHHPAIARQVMAEEIALLAMAELIVTISREETYFLTNLGLPAFYYPYFPPAAIERRLSRVRQARVDTPKEGLLLLGSVTNPATRTGLKNFLRAWKDSPPQQFAERLLVAGYGCRPDDVPVNDPRVEYLGEVEPERLDRILEQVRACVCYQEHGGGALTRICEMLLAGVPVLANPLAARSYFRQKGVVVFEHMSDMAEALQMAAELDGRIPAPVPPDGGILSAAVGRLLRGTDRKQEE